MSYSLAIARVLVKEVSVLFTHWVDSSYPVLHLDTSLFSSTKPQKQQVVLHGNEGKDRSATLSSVSQILLDPYYRTIRGFQILIEKEWLSMGHPFSERNSHWETKEKHQKCPSFPLFLDCVWQIMQQYPSEFEFNGQYLISLYDHSLASPFGRLALKLRTLPVHAG